MKKAFTMLELVFVMVVVGILAAVMISNTRSNSGREAATELVSHIRYTQHLALMDDKFDASDVNWYKNRWQIVFGTNQYSIVSDNNTTFAVNPMDRDKNLSNIDFDSKYSTSITLNGSCIGMTNISFDYLGRPMTGNLNITANSYVAGELINSACIIVLTNGTENVSIRIEPETGYAHIL